MVIVLGIILIGGHFLATTALAELAARHLPSWGVLVFLAGSILFGSAILRLQTRLESYFLRRHIDRNPQSWWNVIDTTGPQQTDQPPAHPEATKSGIRIPRFDFLRNAGRRAFGG